MTIDTSINTDVVVVKEKVARVRVAKRLPATEFSEFKTWLANLELGITPSVHVNGQEFHSCVIAVDFGSPLNPVRITPEQSTELVSRLRQVTKTLMNKEVKIGIMTDHLNGIWWSTIN